MKIGTLHIITVSALLAVPAFADQARIDGYKSELSTIRRPELPQATARLVTSGKADVADAVTAAVTMNSASTPLIVGSVSKAAPSSAAAAAAAAVRAEASLASQISKAAVSAAPEQISAIVTEMCKAQPASFYKIGMAAASAAPRSSDQVVPAIAAGVPALKPLFERVQKDLKAQSRAASLALVLKHADNVVLALAKQEKSSPEALLASTDLTVATKLASLAETQPPPTQAPPFVPGGTPGEIIADNTTEVIPPGRYSTP